MDRPTSEPVESPMGSPGNDGHLRAAKIYVTIVVVVVGVDAMAGVVDVVVGGDDSGDGNGRCHNAVAWIAWYHAEVRILNALESGRNTSTIKITNNKLCMLAHSLGVGPIGKLEHI